MAGSWSFTRTVRRLERAFDVRCNVPCDILAADLAKPERLDDRGLERLDDRPASLLRHRVGVERRHGVRELSRARFAHERVN